MAKLKEDPDVSLSNLFVICAEYLIIIILLQNTDVQKDIQEAQQSIVIVGLEQVSYNLTLFYFNHFPYNFDNKGRDKIVLENV